MGDKTFGHGAKRKCNFYDGTSVVEEIIDFKEGESFVVEITEFSMPLKSLVAETIVKSISGTSCEITIAMNFVVKGGPLRTVMGVIIVKPMMKKLTRKLLNGLACHAATEKLVGNKLPSEQELSLAFSS